jgi:hypothetical protein
MNNETYDEIFNHVANNRNWKLPVNAEIEMNSNDISKVVAAIQWKTGSRDVQFFINPASMKNSNDLVKVRFIAEGWYNAEGRG